MFDISREKLPEVTDVTPGVESVVRAQHLQISPALYHHAKLYSPTLLSMARAFCGWTSIGLIFSLHDVASQQQLAQVTRQIVFIDSKHRRPVQVPQKVRQRFTARIIEPLHVVPQIPPDGAYIFSFRVVHSDTDKLYHINQSVYLRYCMDAAAQAVTEGHIVSFKTDIFDIEVDDVLILHQGEMHPGDECRVTVWQDQHNTHRLHFSLQKQQSAVAYVRIDLSNNQSKL